jgi:hypothetical protein
MRRFMMVATAVTTLGGGATQNAAAQSAADSPFNFELRATGMLPTFDISDTADFGYGGGLGLGYRLNDSFRLMADVDMAKHGTATSGVDINTYHYMAKAGLDVYETDSVILTLNLGAGAVTFGGDLPSSETYFAINAGAKLGIKLSPTFQLLVSPQGDIAFSDADFVSTDNSWVWPLGIGFRVTP